MARVDPQSPLKAKQQAFLGSLMGDPGHPRGQARQRVKSLQGLDKRPSPLYFLLLKFDSRDVPFEFILNTWPPGTSTGTEMYLHEGLECGPVLEGELEVEVSGNIYPIKPGDTITLCSSLSHRISNVGKKKAIAVWVNSVPWLFTTK